MIASSSKAASLFRTDGSFYVILFQWIIQFSYEKNNISTPGCRSNKINEAWKCVQPRGVRADWDGKGCFLQHGDIKSHVLVLIQPNVITRLRLQSGSNIGLYSNADRIYLSQIGIMDNFIHFFPPNLHWIWFWGEILRQSWLNMILSRRLETIFCLG